ncbi:Pleiotropic drug resistance ABC transporter [Quillaja saponaria]|uniref:Pleiotropic drug resistance ABC transporter n=1 Tax=Quillaja saponaria TaxID=32244 RepID=A0AAD7PDM9_QUISA|nr:Pleiotropic drug resistance ABC transporter [Quillaja saponaria]
MDEIENSRPPNKSRSRSIARSFSRASWSMEDVFASGNNSFRNSRVEEEEEALKWAAIEKLPTYDRLRTSIINSFEEQEHPNGNKVMHKEVDVRKLDKNDRQNFIDRIFRVAEEDNEKVGIRLPQVEVRFEELTIEADCYVGNRALPTLPNVARNSAESAIGMLGIRMAKRTKLTILKDASGIIKPSSLLMFHAIQATALEGAKSSLIIDYTLKGLTHAKTPLWVVNYKGGYHGGQKKRVTTGEIIVGPTKTLFMDEISTGLDSSTTFQVVKCLQQIVHITEGTILMSLLQPAPETFDLFDDIILLSEGQIVYQGPREHILEFFESCGFCCPERKGTADFLQEVTSKKDQEQYWADRTRQYRYISVGEFANRFKHFHVGMQVEKELKIRFDKSQGHNAALVFKKFSSVPKMELLKACFDKEWLLIKRNSFFYIFKTVQIIVMAFIAATVFLRTTMHTRNESDGQVYVGALLFTMIANMYNGFPVLAMTITRLPVFYKQRDLLFHPPWTFTVPTVLLSIPISILETTAWMVVTYYTIGFAPEASRFFKQFLLVFLLQQMAAALFRFIAGVCRTMIIANTGGSLVLLVLFMLGGFILPKGEIPNWWVWAYWVSPLKYGYNAIVVNEMHAPRWMNKMSSDNTTRLGKAVLEAIDVYPESRWYWIGTGAALGFAVLFNILFTLALMFLNPIGKPQAIISEEAAREMEEETKEEPRLRMPRSNKESVPRSLALSNANHAREMAMQRMSSRPNPNGLGNSDSGLESENRFAPKRGMVLPFIPLAMSFDSVNYYVDMPPEMKDQGVTEDKLQLLREVTGAFKPGVLTALMGVSGAGKTTLMDVLAGRKTGGYVEGDIRISGFPKKQETFARISGYCEQNDIHSPQVTVRESLIYSAFLRLPKEVSNEEKMIFVDEVIDLVELKNIKDAIVGLPGVTGLSTEQRKRLTIAVELVANPSIIFMDEPTSGLDARAAAIVMRTVRNTVDTGRTVVCTIHQPSIDIFDAFDELLLMKRGGQVIYHGPLGRNSHKIIQYFEAVPGVPKIKDKYNPATWMLEVSAVAAEVRLVMDFAEHYKSSSLYQQNKALVKELSIPPSGANDLYFATQFSQSTWGQFKSCLWKQWLTYWRTPDYNLVRFFFTLASALLLGSIFWKVGTKRENSSNLTIIIGSMYSSVMFVGINNCSTVQPVVSIERSVFYREKAAGMYSALPYAIAQVITEIPYVLFQTTYYTLIVYAMMSFQWTAEKFFWFFFRIPKWWVWYYWICPVAWTVYGLIISQYGDIEATIKVPGVTPDPTIKQYIEDYFGYDPDFIGPVAGVLVGFSAFFAFLYAFGIKTLNFQTR